MTQSERRSVTPGRLAASQAAGLAEGTLRGPDVGKAEAIGRVTARVAHDFNNLLMVIRSETDLAALDLDEDHPAREAIANARQAVDRATALTGKLQALDLRRKPADDNVTDVNVLIARVREMVTTASADAAGRIVCEEERAPGPVLVGARADQLTGVLRALVANACEAMPSGGRLCVTSGTAEVDAARAGVHRVDPGSFGVLGVSDTGSGVPEDVVDRLFEPFVTTKGGAEHPGLGLAIALAAVRRAGGWLEVESQRGQGTAVWVYLPRAGGDRAEGGPDR